MGEILLDELAAQGSHGVKDQSIENHIYTIGLYTHFLGYASTDEQRASVWLMRALNSSVWRGTMLAIAELN